MLKFLNLAKQKTSPVSAICLNNQLYLCMVNKVVQLIKKDLLIDWRQQNPISGILLYLASTIFTSFMAFKGFLSIEVWNALFWIIMLFTSITAISKSFIQEERRSLYYFFSYETYRYHYFKIDLFIHLSNRHWNSFSVHFYHSIR